MAHPKRRTSKSAKNKRRSHLALKPIQIQRDPRTGAARLSHKISETDNALTFSLSGWGKRPYHIMLAGVKTKPKAVEVGGKDSAFAHHPDQNLLVIVLQGKTVIEIQLSRP